MVEVGGHKGTVLLDLTDNVTTTKKVQTNMLSGLVKGAELGYSAVIGRP
jgi:hypothetical protein